MYTKIHLINGVVRALEPRDRYFDVYDDEVTGLHVRVEPSGSKTFRLRYTLPDGGRRCIRIGDVWDVTCTEARKAARKHWASAVQSVDPLAAKQKTHEHTLRTFLKIYEKRVTHKTVSDTVKMVERSFERLLTRPLSEIKPMWVEAWRRARIDKGASPSTVNRELAALRGVLSRAIDWGYLESHPLQGVKQLKIDIARKPRYLELEELKRLYAALDAREEELRVQRDSYNDWRRVRHYELYPALRELPFADFLKPLVIMALNTGCRRGELFSLRWSDVTLDGQHPRITIHGLSAKSGKTRHIPLNATVLDTLTKWRQQSPGMGLVFPSPITGKRLDNIRKTWDNLIKWANLESFRFHDCRHHFASMLVQKGVDLNVVRELLGHASLTMTLRYAYLAPDNAAKAVAVLDVPKNVVTMPKLEEGSA